jgi:hypothetical protein
MPRAGRLLELIVKQLESSLAIDGIKIQSPEEFHDEKGAKFAEVDITLRGNFGSTEIFVGIECRDRKSDGKQGIDWIRELRGKQEDLGIHKMVAVSSTGFSDVAVRLAKQFHIDLREIKNRDEIEASNWFKKLIYRANILSLEEIGENVEIISQPRIGSDDLYIAREEDWLEENGEKLTLDELIFRHINLHFPRQILKAGKLEIICEIISSSLKAMIGNKKFDIQKMTIPIRLDYRIEEYEVLLHVYKDVLNDHELAIAGNAPVNIFGEDLRLIVSGVKNNHDLNKATLNFQFIKSNGDLWIIPSGTVFEFIEFT